MAPLKSINLIKATTNLPSELTAVETYAKRASSVMLAILVVTGLIVGGIFLTLRLTATRLEGTRGALTLGISQGLVKEGLLSGIKARVGIVNKISQTRRSVGPIFDVIASVAAIDQLTSVSLTDEKVVMALESPSIDDVLGVSDRLVKQSEERGIKEPQIVSLTLTRDGNIEVTFSFIAIL